MYMYYQHPMATSFRLGLFWPILFILFVVGIVWMLSSHSRKNESDDEDELPELETALEILKKRYARGEITKRQYLEMKKDIS